MGRRRRIRKMTSRKEANDLQPSSPPPSHAFCKQRGQTRQHTSGAKDSSYPITGLLRPTQAKLKKERPHSVPLEHPGGATLALTRSAKALSLSAAGCLPGRGARRAPISSTRLIRALSLAALLSRLACTWGVGGRQGWTTAVAADTPGECRGAGAQGGGQLPERLPCLPARCLGRSMESLVRVTMELPPSSWVAARKLFALCVTTPKRQAA